MLEEAGDELAAEVLRAIKPDNQKQDKAIAEHVLSYDFQWDCSDTVHVQRAGKFDNNNSET